jgi:hypothetical protein
MSNNKSSIVSQKPALAGDKPPLTAEQVMEQLRALREQIPGFVLEPDSRELARLRQVTREDIQLTREAVTLAGSADAVQSALGNTPTELRDAENEWTQWTTVEGELRSVLRGLVAANLVRRYQLVRAVRQAYKIGRTLTEREAYAHLRPHIDAMFRVKNRKRATKPAPPPDDPQEQ